MFNSDTIDTIEVACRMVTHEAHKEKRVNTRNKGWNARLGFTSDFTGENKGWNAGMGFTCDLKGSKKG